MSRCRSRKFNMQRCAPLVSNAGSTRVRGGARESLEYAVRSCNVVCACNVRAARPLSLRESGGARSQHRRLGARLGGCSEDCEGGSKAAALASGNGRDGCHRG